MFKVGDRVIARRVGGVPSRDNCVGTLFYYDGDCSDWYVRFDIDGVSWWVETVDLEYEDSFAEWVKEVRANV